MKKTERSAPSVHVLVMLILCLALRAIIDQDETYQRFHSRTCYKIDIHGETARVMQIGVCTGPACDHPASWPSGRRFRSQNHSALQVDRDGTLRIGQDSRTMQCPGS